MARKTFPLNDILDLAVAACDVNKPFKAAKYGYLKVSYSLVNNFLGKEVEQEVTPDGYKGMYDSVSYVFCNRDLIKESIGIGTLSRYRPEKNFIPGLVVTDENRETREKIKTYFSTLSFKAMSGTINDFERNVLRILTDSVVKEEEIGIVASMPSAYFHVIKRKQDMEEKIELAKDSSYVGSVGASVELNIRIITHKYINRLQCFVVNAIADEKNMIAFFTGKSKETFGDKCFIKGIVKRTEVSKYNNAQETFLTRVTVKKVYE